MTNQYGYEVHQSVDASHIEAMGFREFMAKEMEVIDFKSLFTQGRGKNGRYGNKFKANEIACAVTMMISFVSLIYAVIIN